jgi:hypothetical protein
LLRSNSDVYSTKAIENNGLYTFQYKFKTTSALIKNTVPGKAVLSNILTVTNVTHFHGHARTQELKAITQQRSNQNVIFEPQREVTSALFEIISSSLQQ